MITRLLRTAGGHASRRGHRVQSLSTVSSKDQAAKWKQDYERDGFLVVESAFSDKEVELLNNEIAAVARGDLGEVKGRDGDAWESYLAFHHPHKVSALYRETMSHERITEVLQAVVSPNVKSMQSMFFVKVSSEQSEGAPIVVARETGD